jgi:hypothetical protein
MAHLLTVYNVQVALFEPGFVAGNNRIYNFNVFFRNLPDDEVM